MKKALLMIITTLMVLGLVGCSSEQGENGDSSKKLYFLPMVDTGAYWSVIKAGAESKASELGYELVTKTSPWSDSQKNEKQIGFVTEGIAGKVGAIAVAPMDPDMLNPKAKEAKEAGIPLITFDADVTETENRLSYIGTNNKAAGHQLGVIAAKEFKEKGITEGKLTIVLTVLTQTTMIDRKDGIIEGFNEEMGSNSSNFSWLETIADDDQASVSKSQLEGQIVSNPDLVGVFSLGSEGPTTGTMEAIKSQGKGGEILHFGIDYTPTWENGIQEQLVTGIIDQDAFKIGETIVETMVKAIEKKEVDDVYSIDVKWIEAKDIVEYGVEKGKLIVE